MKVAAAWSEEAAGERWYPIEAMRWADVPVAVTLADGAYVIVAEIRKHPRRKRYWWYQLGAWGGTAYGWIRSEVIELEMHGRLPHSRQSPIAFRPLDLSTWRYPLPAPCEGMLGPGAFGPNVPPPAVQEATEALDPHQGSDDWPYPDVRLTLGVPASREECEARVLRAFRTSNSQAGGFVGHSDGSYCGDMPGEIAKRALWHCNRERLIEERRQGVAPSAEAVRSGWTPSRRDLGDWVAALSWLNGQPGRAVEIVEMRAADPPFSFRQIAASLRISPTGASDLYKRAIDAAFASAKRKGNP